LAAALLQDGKPLAYKLGALTPAKERHTLNEKETLAMVVQTRKVSSVYVEQPK